MRTAVHANWFLSLKDAREKIEVCRKEYNDFRPHTSLKNLTPIQFRYLNLRQEISNNECFNFGSKSVVYKTLKVKPLF